MNALAPTIPTAAPAYDDYFVNMGPQHPSTHGVLRLVTKLAGETVLGLSPHMGYVHRGIEKMGEAQTAIQFTHLTSRLDYLSAHMNNWGWAMVVEQACGLQVPERAEYIRVIMSELTRISSHQLWWGVFGMDLGAFTPFLYGFRDREKVNDIFEKTCGQRLTMNYIVPGGVVGGCGRGFRQGHEGLLRVLQTADRGVRAAAFRQHHHPGADQGCGHPDARAGPSLRRDRADPAGQRGGLRRAQEPPVRGLRPVRVEDGGLGRVRQLGALQGAAGGDAPEPQDHRAGADPDAQEGPVRAKVPAVLRIPTGRYLSRVEAARGEIAFYLVGDGNPKPYRVKIRSAGFSNLSAFPQVVKGWRVADVVTIMSTFDLVIPDIDR